MKKIKLFLLFILVMLIMPNVNAQEIKTGTYKIHSALDDSKLLVEKNGNIELGDANSGGITTWNIVSNGSNFYIRSTDNSVSLNASGGLNNGTNVKVNAITNSSYQQWKLTYIDGYYYIKSIAGNFNIDVLGASTNVGANIQLYIPNGTFAQKWKLERIDEAQQVLEDGTYIVRAKNNYNNAIDLAGANIANCANIHMYANNFTWAQLWKIKYENGYYRISSALNDNKVMDIIWGQLKPSSNVQLYQANGSNAQKWLIEKNEDNTYSLSSYDGLWKMDIAGGLPTSGANLQLYTSNGTPAQKFIFEKSSTEPLETGYYNIKSLSGDNMVVGVANSQIVNSKNVILTKETDFNHTKWYIKQIYRDIYTIANAGNKKKVLDVSGGLTINGGNVQLYQANGTAAQQWIIRKNGDGTFLIIGVGSKKSLDICARSFVEGANVQIYSFNNTSAQKFNIVPTPVKAYETPENGKYIIKSKLSQDKVIDVTGANKDNNTNIQLYTSNSTKAQIWKLENIGDGGYLIRSMINPKIVLSATSSNVVLKKYDGSDNQKWNFTTDINGELTMYNIGTGKFLNIDGNSNGSNVSLSTTQSNKNEIVLSKFSGSLKYRGIDVSSHNGNVDWASIRHGIDFAVIRAGISGEVISNGNDIYQDTKFLANVQACEQYNIPYAYYLYSYAKTVDGPDNPATGEAWHMINLINKAKDIGGNPNLSVPIYYDQEDKMTYNAVGYDPTALYNINNTFCSIIENNGYQCGIYTYLNGFGYMGYNNVRSLASRYSIWVAQWKWKDFNPYEDQFAVLYKTTGNKSNFEETYGVKEKIWQFSSEGNIPAANTGAGHVDLNIGYDIFD